MAIEIARERESGGEREREGGEGGEGGEISSSNKFLPYQKDSNSG
jgi:hypothetical protein